MDWKPFSTVPRVEDKQILVWEDWGLGDGTGSAHVVEWHEYMGDCPWWDGDVYRREKSMTHWAEIIPPTQHKQDK